MLLGGVTTLITSVQGSTSGLAVLLVIAGLVTWLVGVGRRRERP
jgi:hypothetical protein